MLYSLNPDPKMKQLSIMILSLVIFSTGVSFSQTEEDRINFYDGVFFIAEEDYEESLAAFNKLYFGDYKNNSNLNYLIGLCYLKIPGEKSKAIPYLEKAVLNITDKDRRKVILKKMLPQLKPTCCLLMHTELTKSLIRLN